MALFNRKTIIEIGQPGATGLMFQDLRIKFKGTKTSKPSANKLEVDIYNLSPESFTKISEDGNVLVLSAGYTEDDLPKVIFTGDITRVIKEYTVPDVITKIECFDGIRLLRDKTIAFSYEKGTKIETVVQDIISNFGLPLSNNYRLLNFEFTNGFSFVGTTKDALTRVLSTIDYSWSIQNGQIQILAEKETTTQAIVLSPASGLIGSPENLTEVSGKVKKSNVKAQKYKTTSVLFPEIQIGDSVKIVSRDVDGFFKVLSHEFEGDNKEGAWQSVLEVTAL